MRLPRLGSRGQGWVYGQFVLIGLVVLACALGPRWPWPATVWAGLLCAALGVASGLWAFRSLGAALSPYPPPRRQGVLVEHGPYRWVRHPIYSSGLLALLGLCFVGSWWGLPLLAVLLLWWLAKSHVEEEYLSKYYPGYAEYCQRVRRRLIPGLL